jgi:hypothetical protein
VRFADISGTPEGILKSKISELETKSFIGVLRIVKRYK